MPRRRSHLSFGTVVSHLGVIVAVSVVLGLLTRVVPDDEEARSPAERLEHRISPLSSAVAVPFFALLSAGVQLRGGPALRAVLRLTAVILLLGERRRGR